FVSPRLRTPSSPLFPYTTLFRSELAHDRLPVLEMATSDEVIGPSRDRGVELGVEVRGSLVRVGLIGRHCETQLLTVRDGGTSRQDRKSTRLNSSHVSISYAVFCL